MYLLLFFNFVTVFLIPQRYVLGIMGLLAVCNAYTMRVCLNLAITQMVNNTKVSETYYDPDACPEDETFVVNGTVSEKPVSTLNNYLYIHLYFTLVMK